MTHQQHTTITTPTPTNNHHLNVSAAGEAISDHPPPPSPATLFPPHDDASVAVLMDAEPHHMAQPGYLRRCRDRAVDITARLDAINWILKVQAQYQFQPVTAFLSINYMDRFLSCTAPLPRPSRWAYQLLSVACLSVAAKMEEPQVPLLLDLQLFEPRFVFQPKTVQRMELRVMSNLNWRLRSVTPFDYLHYFYNNLSSSSSSSAAQPQSFNSFFSTASDIILATTHVIDFLEFSPSTVAAAAVLCAAGHSQLPLCFHHQRVNNEMMRRCHQLMEDYLVDTCPSSTHKATRAEAPPEPDSPVAVLDALICDSCDTPSSDRNFFGSAAEQAEAEADAETEAQPPSNKRLRSDVQER